MKRYLYLIIVFLVFIYACNSPSSKNPNEDNHIHEYETEWSYDEDYHYYQSICDHDIKSDEEPHQFIEKVLKEATHNKKGEIQYTCLICEYSKIEKTETIAHDFSEEYYFDERDHYYYCECGKRKNIEQHSYEEGEVVIKETKYTDGLMKYTCKCGKTKEEVIKSYGYEIDEKKEEIYLITTSVGEDISKSVGISWHCKNSRSYLVYYKEGNTDFSEVKPNEEYWSIEESYMTDPYQNKRYVCTVDLTNLESNCKYIYKIISGDISSNSLSFKTADTSSMKYSFLSFVDFQYSENSTTLNLVNTFVEKNPEANLITCSGDITDEGYREKSHRYLFDSTVFSNSILAFGVGDHEYWGTDESPIKMLQKPYSFNKLFNNPNNGCESYLNSSYYFRYNTTLFIFLDCGDSNVSVTNEMFSKQAHWIDNVLTTETNYEFVIVCMHKSLYGDPKQDSAVKKIAPIFTEIFDKHRVDLVISGHDHEYSRTKPITNGIVADFGTIYLDLGNSGSKTRATGEDVKTSNLYDKYIDIKENNYSLGIIGTITEGKLTIEIRNQGYQLVDTVTIEKKNR